MAAKIDLTLECANAQLLADFWKTALGYVDEPPPAPFKTREEWLAQFDLPEGGSEDDGAWLCDPDGVGPRLSILKVSEPKTAKNRLHIDVRVPGHGSPEGPDFLRYRPTGPGAGTGAGTGGRRQ
ncbi:VOC family protein [Kitasatospora sp. NPDC048298]|uniref:VOC family protein n=1 Tax=Kitasatospora sp. NPDC048298 TaxID=3364049 RepID=UPI003719EFDB